MVDELKLQQKTLRIAVLVSSLDSEEVPAGVQAQSKELLESAMDLHAEALDRVLKSLREAGEPGEELPGSLAIDLVMSSVLPPYGLHPLDLEIRNGIPTWETALVRMPSTYDEEAIAP